MPNVWSVKLKIMLVGEVRGCDVEELKG